MSNVPAVSLTVSAAGLPVASSLDVAKHFEKRHDDVLKAIKAKIKLLDAEYRLRNFAETVVERANPSGGMPIVSPAYNLTRDGFTLLAMGFTGKKALAWQVRYIEAFNAMEAELLRQHEPTITPEQCRHLHNLLDSKLSSLPPAEKKRAYGSAWARFNRHFNIAKYNQLPASRYSDAVNYLIEQAPAPRALAAHDVELTPIAWVDEFGNQQRTVRDAVGNQYVDAEPFAKRLLNVMARSLGLNMTVQGLPS